MNEDIKDINFLIEDYYKWLKDKTTLEQLEGGWTEINTPYLDRRNDYIIIYLKQEKDFYILTDASDTIENLEMLGCLLDSPKRQRILERTLKGFGIHRNKNELFIETSYKDFALNKHNLIQAILAVNNMFYMFHEDVKKEDYYTAI